MTRHRLDVLLVARGLADTRARAQALIRAGDVTVDGQVRDKPGMNVSGDAAIAVRAPPQYVGRGGIKLAAALDAFGIDPEGMACLDVGASTGGFTDVLLQRGAARVYAVDVGRGQLAWRLRTDPRVTCLERTDIRALGPLPEAVDLVTVDVAFIGLARVLPALARFATPRAMLVALVKPQFEAGREHVGRGGIVRDPAVQRSALVSVLQHAESLDWRILGATPSPITGQAGNREFFICLGRAGAAAAPISIDAALAGAGL